MPVADEKTAYASREEEIISAPLLRGKSEQVQHLLTYLCVCAGGVRAQPTYTGCGGGLGASFLENLHAHAS